MQSQKAIRLSIPSKGRLESGALDFLSAAGLRCSNPTRANIRPISLPCLISGSSSSVRATLLSVCAKAVWTSASPE